MYVIAKVGNQLFHKITKILSHFMQIRAICALYINIRAALGQEVNKRRPK